MDLSHSRLDLPPYSLWEIRAGRGTPILLIHGLSGSSRWWSRNIEELAKNHLVAAIDLVGFGRNPRFTALPQILPPFREVSALVARWIETFGERVHLVGHSMGGAIALRVAAERPDLLRSLTLVNSAGMPIAFDPMSHVRTLPGAPWSAMSIARVLIPDFLRAGPTSVAIASARVLTGDARQWMQAVPVPTLLIWGENDPLLPLRYAEEMQREIPDSRLIVIPHAAHVAMWDNPEEFNGVLLEFVDEVERGGDPSYDIRVFGWGISGWSEGIAHRQAGERRDIVLVHGLGLSGAYYRPFARALFNLGWNPIAPDLPGFGASADAEAGGPREHAEILAAWADRWGIRNAVWVGHSVACQTVDAIAAARPDLVRATMGIGPLWTRKSHATLRLVGALLADAIGEPLALYPFVITDYWRAGLLRWWNTFRRYRQDVNGAPVSAGAFHLLAGVRDPLVDRERSREIDPSARLDVPGAHACHFSHPADTARALTERAAPPAPSSEASSARDSSVSPGPYSGGAARAD